MDCRENGFLIDSEIYRLNSGTVIQNFKQKSPNSSWLDLKNDNRSTRS